MRIVQQSGRVTSDDDDDALPLHALRGMESEHRPRVRWYADYRSRLNRHALMVWDETLGVYVCAGYAKTFDEAQALYAAMVQASA